MRNLVDPPEDYLHIAVVEVAIQLPDLVRLILWNLARDATTFELEIEQVPLVWFQASRMMSSVGRRNVR